MIDSFYPQILQILSSAVVVEKNSGALDNICGALARLIIANASLIPLDQVNSFLYKEQHKDVRISGLRKRIRVSWERKTNSFNLCAGKEGEIFLWNPVSFINVWSEGCLDCLRGYDLLLWGYFHQLWWD